LKYTKIHELRNIRIKIVPYLEYLEIFARQRKFRICIFQAMKWCNISLEKL